MTSIRVGFNTLLQSANPGDLSIGPLPAPGTPIEITGPHAEKSRAVQGWVDFIENLQDADAELPDVFVMNGPAYYKDADDTKEVLYARRNGKLLAAFATTRYAGTVLTDAVYCQGELSSTATQAVSIGNIEGAQAFHTLLVNGLFAKYDGSNPGHLAVQIDLPFANLAHMVKPPDPFTSDSASANFPFLAAISHYAYTAGNRSNTGGEVIADRFRIPLPGKVLETGKAYSKEDIKRLHAAATAKKSFNGVIAYAPVEDKNKRREDFFRDGALVGSAVMDAAGAEILVVPGGSELANIAVNYTETPTQRRVRFLAWFARLNTQSPIAIG